MTDTPTFKWVVIGCSVRGASHERSELPNQDAIAFRAAADGGTPVVLGVSDGHGSPKCFRSDSGSRFAVDVAVEITTEFLESMRLSPASAIKGAAERLLPGDIIKTWQQVTSQHVQQNPFTTEELDRLEREAGAPAREAILIEGQMLRAYGATLLLVAIGDGFAFYLQLGDGDILAVSDQTRQVERPLPDDPELMANETTSLFMEGAQKMFRFKFQYIQGVPPALVLASTDGYSNSFSTPDDFHKVGTDLLEMMRAEGLDYVSGGLTQWLDEASRSGSGDDVTLGIICRKDIIGSKPPGTDHTPAEAGVLGVDATLSISSAPAPEQEQGGNT